MNKSLTLALGFCSVALLALGGCDTMGDDAMDDTMDDGMEMEDEMEMEDGMDG